MEDSFSDVSKKSFALVMYLLTEKAELEWWFLFPFLKRGREESLAFRSQISRAKQLPLMI